MVFFSKFRTFSRLAGEFEERIAQLETKNAALRRDLGELDEFIHRIARKRYQENYTVPGAIGVSGDGTNVDPGASGVDSAIVTPIKQKIWERLRGKAAQ